jgi:hypothetical protein
MARDNDKLLALIVYMPLCVLLKDSDLWGSYDSVLLSLFDPARHDVTYV